MIADIDKDGSGTIDFEEFLTMMTAKMGERDSKEEILKAFRLFDDDETGKISFKNLKRVAKELGENMTDEELQVSNTCRLPILCLSSCRVLAQLPAQLQIASNMLSVPLCMQAGSPAVACTGCMRSALLAAVYGLGIACCSRCWISPASLPA